MSALWADGERRRSEGETLLARAGDRFGEERYVAGLLDVYAGTHAHA
jgi:hypothetical protein